MDVHFDIGFTPYENLFIFETNKGTLSPQCVNNFSFKAKRILFEPFFTYQQIFPSTSQIWFIHPPPWKGNFYCNIVGPIQKTVCKHWFNFGTVQWWFALRLPPKLDLLPNGISMLNNRKFVYWIPKACVIFYVNSSTAISFGLMINLCSMTC